MYRIPAQGLLTVEHDWAGAVELMVTDLKGAVLIRKSLMDSVTKLDVSALPSGMYQATFR
ncbi:MAG: T9SS type A sorting domain-containing protein, partial [Flavobacteriales bacterium]|nr:T9SS type A sorting domain-containing protein [Flavobacteriales bacterium]